MREKGYTVAQVAERLKCSEASIYRMCQRMGWERPPDDPKVQLDLDELPQHEVVKHWAKQQQQDLLQTARILSTLPLPATRKEAKEHEELMMQHLKRGQELFGLGKGPRTVVNIGVMARLQPDLARTEDGRTVKEALEVLTTGEALEAGVVK